MMSQKTMAFFNDKITWPYVTMQSVYDSTDPGFLIAPTNKVGIKSFLYRKWFDNSDTTWAFDPNSSINQAWPVNENLSYSNNTVKTAGMGGFPLGDVYRWWPSRYAAWNAQSAAERATITNLLGTTDVKDVPSNIPAQYVLEQNYPNPFNPSTEINYSVPVRGAVSLKVYNLLGQEVATLFNGEQQPGTYVAIFDGSRLSSGVYFYELKAHNVSITKKLVLMK
jgi:hypothetical protein